MWPRRCEPRERRSTACSHFSVDCSQALSLEWLLCTALDAHSGGEAHPSKLPAQQADKQHMCLQAPHFARSLEWLLFTALDANSGGEAQPSKLPARPVTSVALAGAGQEAAVGAKAENGSRPAAARPLLQAAADLVRQFPQVIGQAGQA